MPSLKEESKLDTFNRCDLPIVVEVRLSVIIMHTVTA